MTATQAQIEAAVNRWHPCMTSFFWSEWFAVMLVVIGIPLMLVIASWIGY